MDAEWNLPFEVLALKYEKKLFRLILRQVGDQEAAEDLTQAAFLDAHRTFPTATRDCMVRTWLCQIALDQCKNRLRQREREQAPTAVPSQRESYQYVLESISSLPPEYAEVMLLTDFLHLPYAETARILGLSLEAVKQRVHRGRLMLRRKVVAMLHQGGKGSHQPRWERDLKLLCLISTLPDAFRLVIFLSEVARASLSEIACQTGLTALEVTKRIAQGRQILLRLLGEDGEDSSPLRSD